MTIEAVQHCGLMLLISWINSPYWGTLRISQKGRSKLNYGSEIVIIMVSALVILLSGGNQCPG